MIRPPPSFGVTTGVADPAAQIVQASGRDRFETALGRGRRMSLEEAVDVIEADAAGLASKPP